MYLLLISYFWLSKFAIVVWQCRTIASDRRQNLCRQIYLLMKRSGWHIKSKKNNCHLFLIIIRKNMKKRSVGYLYPKLYIQLGELALSWDSKDTDTVKWMEHLISYSSQKWAHDNILFEECWSKKVFFVLAMLS